MADMTNRIAPLLALLFCFACGNTPMPIEISGQTMGTTYRVVVTDQAMEMNAESFRVLVEATLEQVNADYSNWDPDSEVSRFNASESLEFVEISHGFRQMMSLSDAVFHATDERFDLTLTPVIDLWGFGTSGAVETRPNDTDLKAAMSLVGQTRVIERSSDGRQLRKTRPGATIYLTAVAKGYGIDAVAAALADAGATDFMVEIGGDLFVSGQSARGNKWMIGIERPEPGMRQVEEIVALTEVGMATSGDYRNYFEQDGVRFSHIIDATTGAPITHRTASVTVIAESALAADAWATALLVVGAEEGLQIAAENRVDALFIVKQNSRNGDTFEHVMTPGFGAYRQSAEN
ncbi:MAG: FAD:protein FMN transferase [Pseudomonadota bacterium]